MQAQTNATAIYKAEDVSDHILRLAADCVEDWFTDGIPAPEDFLSQLCKVYLYPEGILLGDYQSPAARKIMRHARQTWRDFQ